MKTFTLSILLFFLSLAQGVADSSKTIRLHIKDNTLNRKSNFFLFFHAHRQASGVGMMWQISAPASMFEIERSYDGEYFEVIGVVQGNESSNYRYVDTSVYPGYIHYRIKAYSSDGNAEYSPIETVRIVRRK